MILKKDDEFHANATLFGHGKFTISRYANNFSKGIITKKTRIYLFNNDQCSGFLVATSVGSSFISIIEPDIISELFITGIGDYNIIDIIKNDSIENNYISNYRFKNGKAVCNISIKVSDISNLEKKIPKEVIFKI